MFTVKLNRKVPKKQTTKIMSAKFRKTFDYQLYYMYVEKSKTSGQTVD